MPVNFNRPGANMTLPTAVKPQPGTKTMMPGQGQMLGTMGGDGTGEYPLGTAGPRVDPSSPNYVPPGAAGINALFPVKQPPMMSGLMPPPANVMIPQPRSGLLGAQTPSDGMMFAGGTPGFDFRVGGDSVTSLSPLQQQQAETARIQQAFQQQQAATAAQQASPSLNTDLSQTSLTQEQQDRYADLRAQQAATSALQAQTAAQQAAAVDRGLAGSGPTSSVGSNIPSSQQGISQQPNIYQQASGGIQQAMGATQGELGYQPSMVQGFGYPATSVTPSTGQYAGDVNALMPGYAGDVRPTTGPYAGNVTAPSAGYSGDVAAKIGPYAGNVQAPTAAYAGNVTGMGYSAPSIAQNISQFANPFEQQVVQGALGDIERQRQMTANQLAAQFQGAKAFGGSRQAIQEAELAKSALQQGASTAASLRQQGFGQALQSAAQQAQMGARASEFGIGQGMQAQLANQAARQRFGEFGAQQGLQASLANQAARQRFGEFGTQQNLQASLANQAARQGAAQFGAQQGLQASLANQAARQRFGEFGSQQDIQAQLANQAARQRLGEFGSQQGMQASLANQAARQRFGEFGAGQSMQAQLANQAALARSSEFGLGQGMQAQLANQAAGLAGSQQRLGAASQLGSLANLGFGMGNTVQQQMAQQGALQQQLQQQIMNQGRQQFEGFRNYPAQALGYYAQALGATPTPQSSTTSKQPGLFDYLTLGASMF